MGTSRAWIALALTGLVAGTLPGSALGQARLTEHTLTRSSSDRLPKGSLGDLSWLAGHWRGAALGGVSEEIWSPPAAGVMMGSYRLVRNDSTIFYEILTLNEEGGSLTVRLKHFNADLTGWEERGKVWEFPLVKVDGNRIYFDGMTYERVTEDSIRSYVVVRQGQGEVGETAFGYRRVTPPFAESPRP